MDTIISEANDTMINQLNFGLPETSQYITDRRFVNYFPSGSNIYSGGSSAGNKNIRFYISGDSNQYLDLSSIRLFANIKNIDVSDRAKILKTIRWITCIYGTLQGNSWGSNCPRYRPVC